MDWHAHMLCYCWLPSTPSIHALQVSNPPDWVIAGPLPNCSDAAYLQAFKASLSNGADKLASWTGDAPCPANGSAASSWLGVACSSVGGQQWVSNM